MAKKPAHFIWIHCEEHWLNCRKPERMIEFLGERGSSRRWHLFACACCWRILPLLTDDRSLHAVGVAERLAEGQVEPSAVRDAREMAELARIEAWQAFYRPGVQHNLSALAAASCCLGSPRQTWKHAADATPAGGLEERRSQCQLLRELFGNPFRPFVFDPGWNTPAVASIAAQIYEREAWEDMPVLGDALEDAGCGHEEALRHCRGKDVHMRGCWVLDEILGKK